ncbi:MAG: dihydropyrimidinase [Sphaerochaeta sp.]|jgi:dihydropyrimidinase|nr:dihydropyrimidinase [Spirochaetales bacterium]
MSRLLIQNGLVVDTEWTRHADLLVEDGKITRIAAEIDENSVPEGTEIVHAEGLCILPGVIDAHTHYHLESRGTVTADSFKEGSKAGAYGGVTTVIDFADDLPGKTLAQSAKARIDQMQEGMAIDFSLHQGVYRLRPSLKEELAALKEVGVKVIKLFTTYKNVGYMIEKREELKEVLTLCKELEILVTVHCEDDQVISDAQKAYRGDWGPASHPVLRPSLAEAQAIRTMGELALEVEIPLYVVHLSSKAGLEAVRDLRSQGLRVIVETTPHYLFLNNEKLTGVEGPLYVMTPPLRDEEDTKALQEALLNGEVQVVATDHCAFNREQKLASNDSRTILPGIPGSEELLPLIYTLAAQSGRIGIQQVVNLLSTAPAKAFGLYPQKGAIRVGSDADLVLFDPDHAWTITDQTIHSSAGYSVYNGMTVLGRAVMTYLRGRLVVGDTIYLGITGNGSFIPQTYVGRGKTIMH